MIVEPVIKNKAPEGITLRGYQGVAFSSPSLLLSDMRLEASLPLPPYRPGDPSPRTNR